jgi:hypothetical protein
VQSDAAEVGANGGLHASLGLGFEPLPVTPGSADGYLLFIAEQAAGRTHRSGFWDVLGIGSQRIVDTPPKRSSMIVRPGPDGQARQSRAVLSPSSSGALIVQRLSRLGLGGDELCTHGVVPLHDQARMTAPLPLVKATDIRILPSQIPPLFRSVAAVFASGELPVYTLGRPPSMDKPASSDAARVARGSRVVGTPLSMMRGCAR